MGSVRTSILGGPRPLSSDRRAQPDYTLSCEEPLIYGALRDSSNLGSFSHVDEKDYVSEPKDSGYRACHVLLKVQIDSDGAPVIVEVQIKTLLQHAWGELTH